jgi:hypothetical protein
MARRITPITVSNYPPELGTLIFNEEQLRREIETERNIDFQNSIIDDSERADIADAEIQLKKDVFDVYLKKTFPDIVGNRKMTDEQVDGNDMLNKSKAVELNTATKKLHRNNTKRLANEVNRKRRESEFRFVNYEELYQTYFEDMMELGVHQKNTMNSETDGLNDVQRTIRDIAAMELQLGRPIIPHRDIVESEESDFDSNTYTKPTDILIKPNDINADIPNIRKDIMLEELRTRLNSSKT